MNGSARRWQTKAAPAPSGGPFLRVETVAWAMGKSRLASGRRLLRSPPWLAKIYRPTLARRIPSVLTKDEVAGLLAVMDGETALLARLLYGTGMRLLDGMRLRVKDIELDRHVIIVCKAKGNKDRVVVLPCSLAPAFRLQMLAARASWEAGRQAQRAGVDVPDALAVRYPRLG